MRVSRKIKLAMVAVPVAAIIAGGYLGHPTDAPRPPSAPMVQQAGVRAGFTSPAASSAAGKAAGKTGLGGAVAGHLAYHLIPHVPYVFRPRVFRGSYLFRR